MSTTHPLRFAGLVIKFHTCELQVTICRKWHKTEQTRTSGAVTEEMMDLRASGCAGWNMDPVVGQVTLVGGLTPPDKLLSGRLLSGQCGRPPFPK